MSSARPSFRQIGTPLDVSDADLQKLNEELEVPVLVKSAARSPVVGQNLIQDAAKPPPRPSPARKAEKATREPTRARHARTEVRLAVMVPVYLRDAVNIRAAQERCTSRHLVMRGLQAMGFEVDAADLIEDGRQHPAKR